MMTLKRTGNVKWMGGRPDKQTLADGEALLQITTRTGTELYWVWSDGKRFRLKKWSDGTVYEVNGTRCTCPDHQQRNAHCKHARAIAAATK